MHMNKKGQLNNLIYRTPASSCAIDQYLYGVQ